MNTLLKIVLSSALVVSTGVALTGTAYGHSVQLNSPAAVLITPETAAEHTPQKEVVRKVINDLFHVSWNDMSGRERAKTLFTDSAWTAYAKMSQANVQKMIDKKVTVTVIIDRLEQKGDSVKAKADLSYDRNGRTVKTEAVVFDATTTLNPNGSGKYVITSFKPHN